MWLRVSISAALSLSGFILVRKSDWNSLLVNLHSCLASSMSQALTRLSVLMYLRSVEQSILGTGDICLPFLLVSTLPVVILGM